MFLILKDCICLQNFTLFTLYFLRIVESNANFIKNYFLGKNTIMSRKMGKITVTK